MYRMIWFMTAALLAVCMTAVPAAAQEIRVALVVGNSTYRAVPVIGGSQRDAHDVADVLRRIGFQSVDLATNLDRASMVTVLEEFRVRANSADWALVYFAGHGVQIDKVNYLVPVDAKLLDVHSVQGETVPYEAVMNAVSGARALRIIVLDASRANPFGGLPDLHRPAGLAPPPEPKVGTLVAYAAKDGEVAIDNDGASPFARAFAAEITKPGVELRRVFDNIRDDVLEATGNRQQPFTYSVLPGRRDFYFVPRP
jgi:uncharacterized caspase-like protein